MALKVPDVGEVEMLSRVLNYSATGDVVLKLYVNDITPAEGDVVGSYTICTETGYADATLTGASWTIATNTGVSSGTYAQQDFVLTSGPVNVYGYYVTNAAGTVLIWSERFDTTAALGAGGGTVSVTPYIELD